MSVSVPWYIKLTSLSPLAGCNAVCFRIQRYWVGRRIVAVVLAGEQERMFWCLSLYLLWSFKAWRCLGNSMEAQHHGLCHAILYSGHEGILDQGKSRCFSTTESLLVTVVRMPWDCLLATNIDIWALSNVCLSMSTLIFQSIWGETSPSKRLKHLQTPPFLPVAEHASVVFAWPWAVS